MTYQHIHITFTAAFAIAFSLVAISSNKLSLANTVKLLLKLGLGFSLLGLLVSYIFAQGTLLGLITFKEHDTTLGFIRVYLLGLSMLVAIPLVIAGKLIKNAFIDKNTKPNPSFKQDA